MKKYAATGVVLALAAATPCGAGQPSLDRFRTTARFSVDARELALGSAVATSEPHALFPGASWVHLYFYAFPFAAEDVASVANGNAAALDAKQLRLAAPAARNSSRAVVHLLVEKDMTVSNVSLELPGVTCTIAETPAQVKAAFPDYRFDGQTAALRGSGRFACDLQSIGMGKPVLSWNVNATVPVFPKR